MNGSNKVKTQTIRHAALDKNGCTVQALCNSTALTYIEAYEALKARGRKDNDGFNIWASLRVNPVINGFVFSEIELKHEWTHYNKRNADSWGSTMRICRIKRDTISQFARKHAKGNFYITNRDHALAVVDGVVIDNMQKTKLKSQVTAAWEVTI